MTDIRYSHMRENPINTLKLEAQAIRSRDFTLIELLIVVAIIAILLSILLPSLRHAREKAYMAVCGSQLSQQSRGLNLFMKDENSFYPGAHTQHELQNMVWAPSIKVYLNNYEVFNCPKQKPEFNWSYKEETKSQLRLPANYGYKENENRIWYREGFGYGMNDRGINGWQTNQSQWGLGGWIDTRGRVSHNRLVNPAEMISIADSNSNNLFDYVIDPTNPLEHPGDRHYGGAMVLFADGRVEYKKKSNLVNLSDAVRKLWNNENIAFP